MVVGSGLFVGGKEFTVIERKEKKPCPVRELNETIEVLPTNTTLEVETLPEEECFDPLSPQDNDWGLKGTYEVSQNWGGITHLTLVQIIQSPLPLKQGQLYQTYI